MRRFVAMGLFCGAFAACTPAEDGGGAECVAGRVETCACPGGTGAQSCLDDGTFGACECGSAAVCGNAVLEGAEECDQGALNSDVLPDVCRADCRLPRCGDGVVDFGEQYEDGNTEDGDGCSAQCQREDGWACTEEIPSRCWDDCRCSAAGYWVQHTDLARLGLICPPALTSDCAEGQGCWETEFGSQACGPAPESCEMFDPAGCPDDGTGPRDCVPLLAPGADLAGTCAPRSATAAAVGDACDGRQKSCAGAAACIKLGGYKCTALCECVAGFEENGWCSAGSASCGPEQQCFSFWTNDAPDPEANTRIGYCR